jgi:hypothetical protein
MNPKIFTAQDADKMLPLIGAVARDGVATWKLLQTARRELRKTSARRPRVDGEGSSSIARESVEDRRQKSTIRDLERQIEDLKAELEELGCYLRDPEKGLIDFPAFVGTELVYLCWCPGETKVTHYHGMREGFIGRKPIPPEGSSVVSIDVKNAT